VTKASDEYRDEDAPGTRTSAVTTPESRYELPSWRRRPDYAEAGAWGWLRARLFDRPIRPDRSAALSRERGGRLDRLDMWLVLVLVVSTLALRMWRLEEPFRMHFDEVYHARTAAEFLQDWRYGISHDIYEWTHPHLAKYAMAAGMVAFGNDRASATTQLHVPVRDAAVEPRWDDVSHPGTRVGDRLFVATGSQVRGYDLATRRLVATWDVPGASAVTVDRAGHRVFIGTDRGAILVLDTADLDAARASGAVSGSPAPSAFATVGAGVHLLHATVDGAGLVAATTGDDAVVIDPVTGSELGRHHLAGIAALSDAGTTPALVARPSDVANPRAAASALAQLLGGKAADYEKRLAAQTNRVFIAAVAASGDRRTAVDAAITDGRLAGMTVESTPRVAVADRDGLALVSSDSGAIVQSIAMNGGAAGVALAPDLDAPKLYVSSNPSTGPIVQIVTVGGDAAKGDAVVGPSIKMPGAGSWVGYDSGTQQVHVLGAPPVTRANASPSTVYVIEPHGNAVYADAALGFRPAAVVLDANDQYESSDREVLLALGTDGTAASVDVGSHAFGWRVPGVLAGALMAAFLYLLTRTLFRRRDVAVLVAALSLADGMFFVQSRIGMNDAYVGLFIVAAYTVFAAIWTGTWRRRGAFWIAMPTIGLLLGLALASKWVAAYAIGALGILILARSALGRVVLIGGMIVATTALGYMAITVPAGNSGNLTFMLIMIGLTLVTVLATILHPIAWSVDEARFAVGAPAAGGVVVALAALAAGKINSSIGLGSLRTTPLNVGFGLVLASVAVYAVMWIAGRLRFGPLARPFPPDDPARRLEPSAAAAEGWLRPGWKLGLPVAWIIISLLVVPLAVYLASYLPWAFVEGHRITDSWPPGHTGQTLLQLTGEMYRYHNTLTDAHPASSPWWAWPFDLKPVWFYQQSFAQGTSAAIYDAGNLVVWWLGVPALAFCAWQAFARRSLGLGLIAIGFACQWLSWARIDRAAFQYHYYTSLPFVVMALAYFLAELWHGASRRTWLLARVAAAAAIVGPAAMWLFHRPLCGFVRVDAVNPGSQACPTAIPEFVLTSRTLALAVVVVLAVLLIVRLFSQLERPSEDRDVRGGDGHGGGGGRDLARRLLPLALAAAAAAVALAVVSTRLPDTPLITARGLSVEPIALLIAIPLGILAVVVATARDARRFVAGTLGAIVATFIVFYPNLSGLPLPGALANAYQGLLPTYLYPFQFPVSKVDRSVAGPSLIAQGPALLLIALTVTCLVLAYSAWVWRVALTERRLEAEEADGPVVAGGAGP
jgi:predicted membrane-bound dolichyl-phosphate-mannose-protein mannosyltransferase